MIQIQLIFIHFLGSPDDYTQHSAVLLFNDTITESCDKIYIINDSICEYDFVQDTNEMFYVFISTLDYNVNINGLNARVTIDDKKEAECGKYRIH